MKGTYFIFACIHLFCYKFHKRNFKPSGSYIDSPDFFQYAGTAILIMKK